MKQHIDKYRGELNARMAAQVARAEQAARSRAEAYEKSMKARYEHAHAEQEKKLKESYDRLTALANRISGQKAEIQKSRKTLESMLRTASRVHQEVHRVGTALVDQIDHLETLDEEINIH